LISTRYWSCAGRAAQVEQGRAYGFIADELVTRMGFRVIAVGGAKIRRVDCLMKMQLGHRKSQYVSQQLVVVRNGFHDIGSIYAITIIPMSRCLLNWIKSLYSGA
jgi:hypothetical protein